MKITTITEAGAMILDSKYRIPERAKASLDNYANTRFKQLGLVTKAFKYQFPFYESIQRKRSFNKVFQVLDKTLERFIPYITEAKIKFITTERESSETVFIRIGPIQQVGVADAKKRKILARYLSRLDRKILRAGLPIVLNSMYTAYTKPKSTHRYSVYDSTEERDANTYQVLEIRVSFRSGLGENGYLLLFYAPEILKVLETLHRLAHYAESTYRKPK